MKLVFEVPMAPVAKKSARAVIVAGHATVHRDDKEREDSHTFAALALEHAPPSPLQGPLRLTLTFGIVLAPGRAATWEGPAALAGLVHPTGRPDIDNYQKFTLDAFTRSKRFWHDDAQVVEMRARKVFAKSPSVLVEIEELEFCASAKDWKARCAQKESLLA